jgi:hypothetical protein
LARWAGVGVFVLGVMLSCNGDEPTGPEPVKSVWEWVPTPKCLAPVNDIYFVSANDGWAVAGHQIWHYDGSSWNVFKDLHPADPRYDYGLTQVWFNGPNDGWFAGIENRTYSVYVSHMWHYDGSEFKEVSIPNVRFIYKIHFNAPDDGWAFGGDYALRFDGSKWYKTEFPTLYWSGCFFWTANDGWAVSKAAIYKWNGFDWTPVKTVGEDTWLNCIGFAKSTDGWALGEEALMSGSKTYAWRWDGSKWERDNSFLFPRGGFANFDVDFLNSYYGWAVGDSTFHWNGENWKRYDEPQAESGRGFYCLTVFIIDEQDVWAGGSEGTIIHFKGFGDK